MNIVILAFDGLDHAYVNEYQKWNVLQKAYGRTNLEGYSKGGGNPDYLTDEIFATFITGTVPDVHGVKIPIDLKFSLKDKIPTIFDLTNSIAVDVPSWNRNPKQHEFQNRVGWYLGHSAHRKATGMDEDEYWKKVIKERTTLRDDCYKYFYQDKWFRIIKALEERATLTMIYFWFTDIIGHIIPTGIHHEKMYGMVDLITRDIKLIFGEENTLYMIMSDHGMYRGQHRPNETFWSLSKPLYAPKTDPMMEDWYSIIKNWIDKNV
jgi:hypothetical protein